MLGLAFKAGTDDIRESPSLKIASCLGIWNEVVGYDPKIWLLRLEMADSPEEAAKEADALQQRNGKDFLD